MPRWFAAALILVGLVALDRAFLDGHVAADVLSLLTRLARAINQWTASILGRLPAR
jgi:hypothetical protein